MMRTAEHVDVAIVGGGPAGTAAAITLARNGSRVILCDKAHFPREKCCGDGLTTGALRRLEQLGVAAPKLTGFTRVDTLHVCSPSGRVAKIPLSAGGRRAAAGLRAGVVRRFELDAALITSAREAGVRVLEGHALGAIEPVDRGIAIEAGGQLIRAAHVVAADGAWSTVRKMLEPSGSPRHQSPADWHAYRAYAHGVAENAASELWVWFLAELLPGYAWSFPLADGGANVGICLARGTGESGRELAERWRRFIDSAPLTSLLGTSATLEPVRSWPIPAALSIDRLCALEGRVLFVGDAAGAADPFSGEGIAQALETGIAAAAAISGGGSRDAAARYRAAMAASLALEQRMARACRHLMSSRLGARSAVRAAAANTWTLRNVGRWLYEDFPRTLVVAPRTWHRGVLCQPPPFSPAG